MAVRMLDSIREVRDQVQHSGLDMRVGMHIGKFVAGVIGTKRVRFELG